MYCYNVNYNVLLDVTEVLCACDALMIGDGGVLFVCLFIFGFVFKDIF